jgi:hypothetical protein
MRARPPYGHRRGAVIPRHPLDGLGGAVTRAGPLHRLAALSLAALAACSTEPVPGTDAGPAAECAVRADCQAKGAEHAGEICTPDGRCAACGSDGQCELKERCDPATLRCTFRPGWGDDCRLNDDCPAGKFCVQGLCVPAQDAVLCPDGRCLAAGARCNRTNGVCEEDIGCLADADCAPAELCATALHRCEPRCTPETEGEICAAGQRCFESRCADCAGPADCPGGMVCDPGLLECVVEGQDRCLSDRDCPVGLVCNRATRFCTTAPRPCLSNEDCLAGEACDVGRGKCVPRACPPDRFEPNRDAASAKPILATQSYPDLTLCDRQPDWFALTVSRGDRVGVFVDANPLLDGVVEAVFLDDALRVLARGTLALDHVFARDGTAYLRMQATDAYVPYGLRLSLSRGTPCELDRFEPDDTPAAAVAVRTEGDLDALTLCGADQDFYAVDVPAGRGLRVEIHYDPLEGDADLFLYAPGGTALLGSSQTPDPVDAVELPAAEAEGGVLARVASQDSRAHDTYLLRVEYR